MIGPGAPLFELEKTRPKLKQDAVFLRAQEGVLVKHHDASFMLRGKSVYNVLSALSPLMTGELTLADLCAELPPGQKAAVQSLVRLLFERGLLMDHEPPVATIGIGELQEFGTQISFLEHFGDRGARGFERCRNARVIVVGDRALGAVVVATLRRNGSAGAHFMSTAVCDPAFDAAPIGFGKVDLVCFASLVPDPRAAARLAAISEARNIGYLLAWRLGDELVLGPLTTNPDKGTEFGADAACWRCLWLRMLDNGVHGAADFWAGVTLGAAAMQPTTVIADSAGAMAGGVLAFEIFKYLSGVMKSELQDAAVVIDLKHFSTSKERVLVHPCCDHHQDWLIGAGAQAGNPSPAERDPLLAGRTFVSRRAGIFTAFRDEALEQLPIATAAIEAPALPSAFTNRGLVYGFAPSAMADARADALYRALEIYAAHLLGRGDGKQDQRQPNGSQLRILEPHEIATWTGASAHRSSIVGKTVRAQSLDGLTEYRVPFGAVAAVPVINHWAEYEPTMDGLAAAASYEGAVSRGLVQAAGLIDLLALARGARQIAAVPARLTEDNEHLRFYLAAARNLDCPVDVYQVSGGGPVHVALVVAGGALGGSLIARAGRSCSEALEQALLQTCGWAQLALGGIDPTPIESGLLNTLRWQLVRVVESGLDNRNAAPATNDEIVAHLRSVGLEPLVVNLTPPDVAELGVAHVVRVLTRRVAGTDAPRGAA
jgi:hypothetical protein